MTMKLLIAGAFLAAAAMPMTAQAQGVPGGAAHGFYEGGRIAGPVGAVVGTAVGGVIGGVEGVLGVNQRYVAAEPVAVVRPAPVRVRHVVRKHSRKHRHHY